MPPRQQDHRDFSDSAPQPLQSEVLVHEVIEIPDLHPFYQFAYAQAQKGFGDRVNMSDFTNRKDLARDVALVNEKLELIRETCQKGTEFEKMAIVQSDVFEYMLHQHIQEAQWFGPETQSILPSIYDDMFNGTDLIIEQHVGLQAYSFSALGIDATFSAEGAVKKLERNKDFLSTGRLGRVKYFKSDRANFRGSIDNVPHFVIGLGRPALFEMLGKYVQSGAVKENNQEARRMVLEQIIAQARYFAHFLKSKGFELDAERYELVEREMLKLLASTQPLTNKKGVDEVHRSILAYCSQKI